MAGDFTIPTGPALLYIVELDIISVVRDVALAISGINGVFQPVVDILQLLPFVTVAVPN